MLIFIKCLLAVFATRGYDLGSVDRVRAFGIAQGASREHAQEPASAGHSWSGIIRIFRLVAVVSFLEQLAGDLNNEHINPTTAANRIVEVVQTYGLREVEPAEPLTRITENDVGVVCWLAALPKEQP